MNSLETKAPSVSASFERSVNERFWREAIAGKEIEQAILITCAADLERTLCQATEHAFSRLYFGSEFCQELLPSIEEIEKAFDAAESHNLAFTLVTPYLSDRKLLQLRESLEFLSQKCPGAEVVANDWGALRILNEYPLTPIAGRLFAKNRKDPRIASLFSKLSKKLQVRYRQSNIINPSFLSFIGEKFGVQRVEVDLPAWGTDFSILNSQHSPRISLHYPLTYLTTARVCPIRHGMSSDDVKSGVCARLCENSSFKLKNSAFPEEMLLLGNSYFYQIDNSFNLNSMQIDRLIYNLPFFLED